MSNISGKTLISWGLEPGPWFKEALSTARHMRNNAVPDRLIVAALKEMQPEPQPEVPLRTNSIPFGQFIESETDAERANVSSVVSHMDALMRVPTIKRGAVMPDACPSGSAPGTIPVGGVVATENAIHPGFHSADICCSVAISVLKRDVAADYLLDIAMKATHFGPGKRSASETRSNKDLMRLVDNFEHNPFLKGLEDRAIRQFMTQGDGNHFLFVGRLESTGEIAIVTHHGSRGLGGQLYKRGKAAAERHTKAVAGRIPMHNAWIEADSQIGQDYWQALQVTRLWTKLNHFALHNLIAKRLGNKITGQFWNEHNFVFQKSDGLFYHAKGATPSYAGFARDDQGLTMIPLNMAEPILITSHADKGDALGFAPHGAGRNLSRTAHIRRLREEFGDDRGLGPNAIAEIMQRETGNLDVRFYSGAPDVSELPSAYKNAKQVEAQINKFELARIEDRVLPLGTIMAGEMKWSSRK